MLLGKAQDLRCRLTYLEWWSNIIDRNSRFESRGKRRWVFNSFAWVSLIFGAVNRVSKCFPTVLHQLKNFRYVGRSVSRCSFGLFHASVSAALIASFSFFWRNKSRRMRSPSCLCVLPLSFLMSDPIIMKLGMYIIAPEPVSMACFFNPSHQSVYRYVYPPIVAR
jgi:hypothetical protein